jgi:kynurenine formamidase
LTKVAVQDPYSGLQLTELSHPWGHGAPSMPGHADVALHRAVKHAQHGVMATRVRMVMHTGTHMNAPLHLVQRGMGIGDLPLDRFFGNGVVLDVAKARWELITPADFEAATADIRSGDFVVAVTGWHRRYADSLEYFGDAPGLSKDGAEWLVERGIRVFAIDTPQVDHPLATSLAGHRGGPLMNRLAKTYAAATGRDPKADHPHWNIAHRTLLAAGIPTIEQVGGDVDTLAGRRATFHAAPWRGKALDACPVRFVALTDPSGGARIETGLAG